jgi:hypothetical protein
MLFCVFAFPETLKKKGQIVVSHHVNFWIIYDSYAVGVVNTFMLSSSWLTVAMAVSRYLAICHPLRAKQVISLTRTYIVIGLVFIWSILFNLPRFWMKEIQYSSKFYFSYHGPMEYNEIANITYKWLYFVVGIIIPLIMLAYCNVYFIKSLHQSAKLQKRHSGTIAYSIKCKSIVTAMLCVIVVFYILLIGPAEVLDFLEPYIDESSYSMESYEKFNVVIHICNALQSLNFAINFILYVTINAVFRKVIKDILCCSFPQCSRHRHSHVDMTPPEFYNYPMISVNSNNADSDSADVYTPKDTVETKM